MAGPDITSILDTTRSQGLAWGRAGKGGVVTEPTVFPHATTTVGVGCHKTIHRNKQANNRIWQVHYMWSRVMNT